MFPPRRYHSVSVRLWPCLQCVCVSTPRGGKGIQIQNLSRVDAFKITASTHPESTIGVALSMSVRLFKPHPLSRHSLVGPTYLVRFIFTCAMTSLFTGGRNIIKVLNDRRRGRSHVAVQYHVAVRIYCIQFAFKTAHISASNMVKCPFKLKVNLSLSFI